MIMDFKKQTQFELFPRALNGEPRAKFGLAWKDLTLSAERIIVISILGVMFLIFSFALGVEKGKRIAALSLGQQTVKSITALKGSATVPIQALPQRAPLAPKGRINPSLDAKTGKPAGFKPAVTTPTNSQVALKVPLPSPVMTKGRYTIQVASFKSSQHAQEEARRLQKKGYPIFVLAKGNHSIVCVGKFVEEEEAKQFAYKLKSQYKDYLIRRL